MEALVNFQTMVCDLTGMPIANASMLDEATAAAEAMTLAKRSVKSKSNVFVVAGDCHPQTIEVVQTRAAPLGIEVVLANSAEEWDAALAGDYFGVLAQYPSTSGRIDDLRADVDKVHAQAGRLHRGGRPAGADPAGAARRVRRRHRRAAPPSASACRWAPAARTRPTWPAATSSSARCPAAWSASASTRTATRPTAWRCRRASSTSAARRPRPTSARRRCCRPWSPACTPSTTARRACRRIAQRVASYTAILAKGLEQLGYPPRPTRRLRHPQRCTPATTTEAHRSPRAFQACQPARSTARSTSCISLDETTTRDDVELLWSLFVKPGQAAARVRRLRERHRAADPGRAAPHQRLPDAPGVQHAP